MHVGDIGDISSTPMGCNAVMLETSETVKKLDSMIEKPSVLAFQNFLWIENPLNIKEVMSKNISNKNNAAMLLMSHVGDIGDVKYLNK